MSYNVYGLFGEHLGRPKIAHGSHNDVRRLCWPNIACESPLAETTPKGSVCWEKKVAPSRFRCGAVCVKSFISYLIAVGRWFPPGTPVSSTRKLISSSSFHRLDMTLAVAEALTPNKPNQIRCGGKRGSVQRILGRERAYMEEKGLPSSLTQGEGVCHSRPHFKIVFFAYVYVYPVIFTGGAASIVIKLLQFHRPEGGRCGGGRSSVQF